MHASTGIEEFFEFVLAREDYRKSKPDPEPYLEARRRLAVPTERCIAIEDTERGLAAARAAGLRCVIIPHDFTRNCKFAGAEAVIGSAGQLPGLLTQL
jgi:beta-phosphoglucomutase-like phosphatase (HAD superfamily)